MEADLQLSWPDQQLLSNLIIKDAQLGQTSTPMINALYSHYIEAKGRGGGEAEKAASKVNYYSPGVNQGDTRVSS